MQYVGKRICTARQLEYAALVVKGLGNKQIGNRLGVSWYTVRRMLHKFASAYNLQDRTEIALFYYHRFMPDDERTALQRRSRKCYQQAKFTPQQQRLVNVMLTNPEYDYHRLAAIMQCSMRCVTWRMKSVANALGISAYHVRVAVALHFTALQQ